MSKKKYFLFLFLVFNILVVIVGCANTEENTKVIDYSQHEEKFSNEIKDYIGENFGIQGLEPGWYGFIEKYEVKMKENGTENTYVNIYLNIGNWREWDNKTKKSVSSIPGAVMLFINSKVDGASYYANEVRVITKNDELILKSENPFSAEAWKNFKNK